MLQIAPETARAFDARMEKRQIPTKERGAFRKWIRFYLDFCEKYRREARDDESLPAFLAKLREKGQSGSRQEQAARAVQLLLTRAARKPAPRRARRGILADLAIQANPEGFGKSLVSTSEGRVGKGNTKASMRR